MARSSGALPQAILKSRCCPDFLIYLHSETRSRKAYVFRILFINKY